MQSAGYAISDWKPMKYRLYYCIYVWMKAVFFGSLASLVMSLRTLKASGKWEDSKDETIFWQRSLFCASEYLVFLTGIVAVACPCVRAA